MLISVQKNFSEPVVIQGDKSFPVGNIVTEV